MPKREPKILVVDDEQHQLDTICRGLFIYGHKCIGVLNVVSALKALDDPEGDSFDLLLTDLTMPGSSGIELIQEVQQKSPRLPIVVITGLAASIEINVVRELGFPILQKPFAPDKLDRTIRETLRSCT